MTTAGRNRVKPLSKFLNQLNVWYVLKRTYIEIYLQILLVGFILGRTVKYQFGRSLVCGDFFVRNMSYAVSKTFEPMVRKCIPKPIFIHYRERNRANGSVLF